MKTLALVSGVLATALGGSALAAQDFPFTTKNLTIEEAQRCPGGYGSYGMVWTRLPVQLKKAPAFKTAYPLYATLETGEDHGTNTVPLLFALDESNGTGKGYDRLLIDLNGNGDLTDDAVLELSPTSRQAGARNEFATFGPTDLPATHTLGPWRPRFYAEVILYNKQAIRSGDKSGMQNIGQIRLQAANLLEAQVEVDGVKQRFGLVDGNCNFRIGEPAHLVKYKRSETEGDYWYLSTADYFLRDWNSSGDYDRTVGEAEAEVFGPIVYFGTKPYAVTVAADLKSIRFEPYAGAVGELKCASEVSDLVLARQGETDKDKWEAITPAVRGGKAVLPAGTYRVASCSLSSNTKAQPWVRMSSAQPGETTFRIASAEPATLGYGLPLKLQVTTERDRNRRNPTDPDEGLWARFRNWLSGVGEPEDTLTLNLAVYGASKEQYAGFISSAGQLKPPLFEIFDATGNQVATGKFEFG